jgi:signal transduction histidine kinase
VRRVSLPRLDLVVAIVLTVAAEAQILAGATATGLVLAPALVAPAITMPVAVRRRWPAAVALWVSCVATAQVAIWGDPQVVGVTVGYLCALYGIAVWAETRRFVAVAALTVAVTPLVAALGPDTSFRSAVLFTTVVVVAMVILRHVVTGREKRARIAQRERDVLAREAVVAERARIAGELHDAIAHNMSMVVMQAGAERRMLESGGGSPLDVMQTIENVGRDALAEMRRLVGMLRSDDVAPLAPEPRLADLPAPVQVRGEPRALPVGIELAAYRIVEEALAAGPARIEIRYGPEELEIDIAQHEPAPPAIRERVALFGGRLDEGANGVRVVLPVR